MTTITTAGNLTADPELRHTQGGRAVVRFTILENRRKRTTDGQGWEDDEPNRFRIQAWGPLAENIAASVSKGDRVHVSGRIITDRWTDKDSGETRTAQRVDADEVAVSLRWHTVTATRNDRQAAAPAPVDEPAVTGWDVVDIPEGDTPF